MFNNLPGNAGSGSSHLVAVHVTGKGKAAGELTLSFDWSVTGIDPDIGSFGGKDLFHIRAAPSENVFSGLCRQ